MDTKSTVCIRPTTAMMDRTGTEDEEPGEEDGENQVDAVMKHRRLCSNKTRKVGCRNSGRMVSGLRKAEGCSKSE